MKFDYFLRNHPLRHLTEHRSLTYLDQRQFNNAKIRRWQEEISYYKFNVEFVEGESNVWADMLCRGCGHKKVKTCSDPTPAGSDLHIYIPSWCIGEVDSLRVIPRTHTPQNTRYPKGVTNAFFAYHSTYTIPTERICNHLGIAAEQMKDDAFSTIIRALELSSLDEIDEDPDDHRAALLRKHLKPVFFSGTRYLCPNDKGQQSLSKLSNTVQTPSPDYFTKHTRATIHSCVTRMRELLSNNWWESKIAT